MGIKNLNQLIERFAPSVPEVKKLEVFRGQIWVLDLAIYLNRFKKAAGEDSWVFNLINFLCILKEAGIQTICVFDGQNAPLEKTQERARRKNEHKKLETRLDVITKLSDDILECYQKRYTEVPIELQKRCQKAFGTRTQYKSLINWSEFTSSLKALDYTKNKLSNAANYITPEDNKKAKKLINLLGLVTYTADGEGEALCSYLTHYGFADAVLTEDTDVLAYGASQFVCFKQDGYKKRQVTHIFYTKLLSTLEMTKNSFRDLCIVLGCDYNKRCKAKLPSTNATKNIGCMGAYELIKHFDSIDTAAIDNIENVEILKHERCREIFNIPTIKDVQLMIGGSRIRHSVDPDYDKLTEFLSEENLSWVIENIKKSFMCGKINYINT